MRDVTLLSIIVLSLNVSLASSPCSSQCFGRVICEQKLGKILGTRHDVHVAESWGEVCEQD